MNAFILDKEVFLRLCFFFGVFGLMAVFEMIAPRRMLTVSKPSRWFANLSLTFMNSLLLRFVFPITAAGIAMAAAGRGWGIFNTLSVPDLVAGLLSVLLLDFAIYLQHRIFHEVRPFWRLHMMHHTDLDIDVTTGARFHPAEIILSMLIKIAVVVAIGAPAWSVIVFEILLNATSMFNHSNVAISPGLDRTLRKFLVTPDMHRVHHSVIIRETNSNYGFNLPWWDRMLGTYIDQPSAGHEKMAIGLANFRAQEALTLPRLLAIPFLGKDR